MGNGGAENGKAANGGAGNSGVEIEKREMVERKMEEWEGEVREIEVRNGDTLLLAKENRTTIYSVDNQQYYKRILRSAPHILRLRNDTSASGTDREVYVQRLLYFKTGKYKKAYNNVISCT